MTASRLLALGLVLSPVVLMAQKREDFIAIQRDIAQLQDQLRQVQTAQDQKFAALQSAIQQALDESNKIGTSLATLQKTITDKLSDQQTKIEGPVATLGTKVDGMADDFRSVRETVADLASRMNRLDSKLTDMSSAIRTLSAPPVAPPPPAGAPASAGGTAGSTSAPSGPPPGMTAEGLFPQARSDFSSGNDELALEEFAQYLKYFSDTENAPSAQYYIGQIYDRAKKYDDAVEAFDAVLERFPENPRSPEALYWKGVDLMKAGRKTDAGTEFKNFLKRYPRNELAPKAQSHLRELGLAAPARPASKARQK